MESSARKESPAGSSSAIPCKFPVNGNSRRRDAFADDCFHRQDARLEHSPQPVRAGKFPKFHRVLAEKLWTARGREMALWALFVLSVSKAVYCADLVRNREALPFQRLSWTSVRVFA